MKNGNTYISALHLYYDNLQFSIYSRVHLYEIYDALFKSTWKYHFNYCRICAFIVSTVKLSLMASTFKYTF